MREPKDKPSSRPDLTVNSRTGHREFIEVTIFSPFSSSHSNYAETAFHQVADRKREQHADLMGGTQPPTQLHIFVINALGGWDSTIRRYLKDLSQSIVHKGKTPLFAHTFVQLRLETIIATELANAPLYLRVRDGEDDNLT